MQSNNLKRNTIKRRVLNAIAILFYIFIWSFWFFAVQDRGPYGTEPVYMISLILILITFFYPIL